ncbi:Hypothetical_protein [Hexamita inflata]|uniref:Hypothetical_protein n=1 Tax=Hexamita inflata TaxID=28002 RepID=A0ABP1HZD7_9EUKA
MEIQSNLSNLSTLVFETYSDLKEDILTTNLTLHNDISLLNNQIVQKFQQSYDLNQQTQSIIHGYQNETTNKLQMMNNKLNNLTSIINDNQANILNNFTKTFAQITDLKTMIETNFDQVDSSITSINSLNQQIRVQLNSINSAIIDNQVQIKNNFSYTQQMITDIKTIINSNQISTNNQFWTITNQLPTIKSDIAATNTFIDGRISNLLTQLKAETNTIKNDIYSSRQLIIQLQNSINSLANSNSGGQIDSTQYNCLMENIFRSDPGYDMVRQCGGWYSDYGIIH